MRRFGGSVTEFQTTLKEQKPMKTAMLLIVLSTLAACAQTTGSPGVSYVSGDGDYYQGIVSPK